MRDEQARTLTHGYSQDHRPDLKQAVWERMVSHDGGVPMVRQSWEGTASDPQMFPERAEVLMEAFASPPTLRFLVAEAKLYPEDHADTLAKLGCITRLPGNRKLVGQVITQAIKWAGWPRLDATTRYHGLELCHYGMAQRGRVIASEAAMERAEASVTKAQHLAIATALMS